MRRPPGIRAALVFLVLAAVVSRSRVREPAAASPLGGGALRRLHPLELPLDRVGRRQGRRLGRRQPDAALLHRLHAVRSSSLAAPRCGAAARRARDRDGGSRQLGLPRGGRVRRQSKAVSPIPSATRMRTPRSSSPLSGRPPCSPRGERRRGRRAACSSPSRDCCSSSACSPRAAARCLPSRSRSSSTSHSCPIGRDRC